MPYVTAMPDATIDLTADTPVVSLGDNLVLNDLSASQEFDLYDIQETSGATVDPGDQFDAVQSDGTPVVSGQYAGDATISTASSTVNVLGALGVNLGSLTLDVNSISGEMMIDGSGNAYFVSDDPLDEDHMQVTVNFALLGINTPSITVPISGLADALAANPLLAGIIGPVTTAATNAVQGILDTAIVNVDYDPDATLTLADDQVFCFVAGTMIQTETGPVAVETLVAGDMVLTRDRGYQPILWVGSVRLADASLRRNPRLRPIRIKAGALGMGTPEADLLVSPQHRVLVRSKIAVKMFGTSEVLIAAKQLLQVDGIDYADDVNEVLYVHFTFDRHEVVLSNGAETESFYTGEQALKSVDKAAREEIFSLFPMLRDPAFVPEPARLVPSGRRSRKMVTRHVQHGRELVG
ncbi:Hint domain-containing protein [Paracoccus sp. CPCC 101403]|uniref:Hint domain-containing protein n=2 Tax=Paracoccus broussonetiae TaxID=3075834 RepID=A0ABU3EJM3_9RHOB|nr:Hint domain-containing protein [Paracoccus sp. CPCC 101403]MDT1064281.1 Hint domain-containing protein [Paracoccus sp. CPCC 101403]